MTRDMNLYDTPFYTENGKVWRNSFWSSVDQCREPLNWDVSSILSLLSFDYACGDRTLLSEVKRSPWLSSLDIEGNLHLGDIPSHGLNRVEPKDFARTMLKLLREEAVAACTGKNEIYILLSGGLDSRIVAGVLSRAYESGEIKVKPTALSWGLEDCRDVQYAETTAKILGFGFKHIKISSDDLYKNIVEPSKEIACLVAPNHLHCMSWLKCLSKDSVVLAGSYGDSIGRAEFSGRHLLELDYLKPMNTFGLLKEELIEPAYIGLKKDFQELKNRSGDVEQYVHCEHQQQGFYMRSLIGHAMNTINQYTTLYQMFTAPSVFRYVWSIHPSYRNDLMYAELLELLHPVLARMPWARTNKALKGKTRSMKNSLVKEFHDYKGWIRGPLYSDILKIVDPDWFEQNGIFDPSSVRKLNNAILANTASYSKYGMRPFEIWVWLASFRGFAEELVNRSKSIIPASNQYAKASKVLSINRDARSSLRRSLSSVKPIHSIISKIRKFYVNRVARIKW